jgi:hypothetical protein
VGFNNYRRPHKDILNEFTAMENKSLEVEKFIIKFPMNIHIVNREGIRNWILPSFLPIAYLATLNT